jgi:hypothetical protein
MAKNKQITVVLKVHVRFASTVPDPAVQEHFRDRGYTFKEVPGGVWAFKVKPSGGQK